MYTPIAPPNEKKKNKLPHFLIIRSFCCVWTQFRSFRFEPNFENATNPTPSKSTKPPVFPTRDLPMCFQIHQVLLLLSFRLLTSVPKRIHGINSTTIIRVCSCFFSKEWLALTTLWKKIQHIDENIHTYLISTSGEKGWTLSWLYRVSVKKTASGRHMSLVEPIIDIIKIIQITLCANPSSLIFSPFGLIKSISPRDS